MHVLSTTVIKEQANQNFLIFKEAGLWVSYSKYFTDEMTCLKELFIVYALLDLYSITLVKANFLKC